MSNPAYEGVFNLPSIKRGNTLRARTFTVTRDAAATPIASGRIVFKSRLGAFSYEAPLSITANALTMLEISGDTTANWPVGVMDYEIKFVYAGGFARNYITGTLLIDANIA